MSVRSLRRCTRLEARHRVFQSSKMPVSAAVFFAVYGVPYTAFADDLKTSTPNDVSEVIVTANRREQALEEIPYSLSVLNTDEITRIGISDIASLASTVPGISTYNFGARFAAAAPPVIRGLNATGEPTAFRSFEQNPVATYIGNSPLVDGYFQLQDVQ